MCSRRALPASHHVIVSVHSRYLLSHPMSSLPGHHLPSDMLRLESGTHYRQVRQSAVSLLRGVAEVAQFIPMPRGRPKIDEAGRPGGLVA
jgi:hypothetical protein